MTIAADLSNFAFSAAGVNTGGFTMRNKIINGAMVIDQRNSGASVTMSTYYAYTLDRWLAYTDQSSKFSVQQNAGSVTPPVGFKNYLGVTSLSAYTVGAAEIFAIWQAIEGYNIVDLAWGTASAQTVTLSFWVRSSLTGTFGGGLRNSGGTRSYPFSYTILAANTWEYKTITIPGDTTGTWLSTNGIGVYVQFGLGVGSTFSGTAGSWSGNNYLSATGATSVVGTNGATFYITGVQLEKGSSATPFEYRNYQQELAMCQRYYQKSSGSNLLSFDGYNVTSSSCVLQGFLPVQMRTTPTGSFSAVGDFTFVNTNSGNFVVLGRTPGTYTIGTDASASARCQWYASTSNAAVIFSAEL